MATLKNRISDPALAEVKAALNQYVAEVLRSPLAESSQATYTDHVSSFVRWLQYDFEPGSRTSPARKPDRPSKLPPKA